MKTHLKVTAARRSVVVIVSLVLAALSQSRAADDTAARDVRSLERMATKSAKGRLTAGRSPARP